MASLSDDFMCTPFSTLLASATSSTAKSELAPTCLGDLRASQATVYDFWTTRCVNCPGALDGLDNMALQRPLVTFVSVNIDDASAANALVEKAAAENRWTRLTHVHLEEEVKEKVRYLLGMRTVPFYVVVDQDGALLRYGNTKSLPLKSVELLDSVLAGGQKENDPAIVNVSQVTESKSSAPSTGGVQCEGGVCKLVRKSKATAPAPAPVTKGSECEGGVCKLVRKNKTTNSSPEPAPSGPARGVECEGGVCKLVRKTRTLEAPKTASSDGKTQTEPAKGGAATGKAAEGSLGVGGVMPELRVVGMDGGKVQTLDDIRAGGAAVLDFWTTRCVRCPSALDSLQELALASGAAAVNISPVQKVCKGYAYIAINLDNLEGARAMISEGRWPSLTHVYAGREEDTEDLEMFKTRAALKSVPFYVVVGEDGIVEQIGGPKAVDLGKTAARHEATAPAAVASATPPVADSAAFTMDEDF